MRRNAAKKAAGRANHVPVRSAPACSTHMYARVRDVAAARMHGARPPPYKGNEIKDTTFTRERDDSLFLLYV